MDKQQGIRQNLVAARSGKQTNCTQRADTDTIHNLQAMECQATLVQFLPPFPRIGQDVTKLLQTDADDRERLQS